MVELANRAKVSTATTGTGTVTLGAAKIGYQTFAGAGVPDNALVRYVIEDGTDWEVGTGTYTADGATLSRTVTESSIAGAALNLSGDAVVYIGATAEDLVALRPYASRADAIAANIVAEVVRILVKTSTGDTLAYKADASGTALTTAGGRNWSPDGPATPQHFGAIGDGSTNDSAAVAAASAYGVEFTVHGGVYLISDNVNITVSARILDGAKFSIAASKTLTFSADPIAGDYQIFEGSGDVSGLECSKMVWFAGDALNAATDALTSLQKGADACKTSGEVIFSRGYYTITGATPVVFSKGQKVSGSGPYKSEIRYTSTTSNCVSFTTTIYPSLKDMSFNSTYTDAFPTAGAVVANTVVGFSTSNIVIRWGSIGLQSAARGKATNIEIFDCKRNAINLTGLNDFVVDVFFITAPLNIVTISSTVGFVSGEVLTGGTSAATGVLQAIENSTVIRAKFPTANFTDGETITGGTSGATATVTSTDVPHSAGALRLLDKAEAVVASNGEIVGGSYPLQLTATLNTVGNRPAYSRFSNVFFDSADNGAFLDNCYDISFSNCWFSNRPNDGCNLATTNKVKFDNCSFINSGKSGVRLTAAAVDTSIVNCTISGNNVMGGTEPGIAVAANTNDFVIIGNRIGRGAGDPFGTQNRGVLVNGGTSDRYIITNNLVSGNTLAGVTDAGTGANKNVSNNF
jgi:hypothetical protein